MTKPQWNTIQPGTTRVQMKSWEIDRTVNPPKPKDILLTGTVIRINSNWSQVLVHWDRGTEVWHGRTQLELLT